jgi:cell division ATPase FtsA
VAFGNWAADQIERGVKTVTEAELTAAVANQKKTPKKSAPRTKLEQAQQAIKKLSDEERLKLWEWIERDYDVRVPDIETEVQDAKVTPIQEPEAA